MSTSSAFRLRLRPDAVLGWLGAALWVAAVYAGVVLGGGMLLGQTGLPHLGLSILATAVVAASIEAVHDRCRRSAAHLLHGGRPSPYDVLARFSAQVSSAERAEHMPQRMAEVLAEGTAATWAQVWLLMNGRPTLVASYPEGAREPVDPPSLSTPERTAGRRTVTVTHAGRQLAMLRVQERPDRPLSPVEERLFAGLAAQAGLALHTAQLRAELAARRGELSTRAAELRRTRDRLVEIQDRERRRLERDIHDGAQQQLVALGINLRLGQTLAVDAPERTVELLAEQRIAVAGAIDTLITLSRGDRPRVLSRDGLSEAVRAAVADSPVQATVTASDVGRFSHDVEAALYFCCVEALQNVAKHADASRVEVRLSADDTELRLTVADNGCGIVADARPGAGLANLRDRLAAVAGELAVDSAPGRGTAVTAVVPAVRRPEQHRG